MAVLARISGVATIIVVLAAAVLHPWWPGARAAVLVALAARIAVMGWSVVRRELPWTRLLLPAIILVELLGLPGYARLATAVVLEIVFVTVAVVVLRRASGGGEPPEARIASALATLVPPRIARLAAFELVIASAGVRFLFGGWRRAVPEGITYHRDSGLRMLLPLIPLLAIGDVLLIELVILRHAPAWLRVVVHVVAVYGLVWLAGLYSSLRARPHRVAGGVLTLHRGLLRRVAVPVEQIESIAPLPSFADDWKKRAYCKGAIRVDVAGPAILELTLREPVRPIGVLGEGAPSTRVLVAADDPTALQAATGR